MPATIIYIMGVSGSGKSTIGELLGQRLGIPYYDGDDLHPEANRTKMTSGHSLDDHDRQAWLEAIHTLAVICAGERGAVIACSALKQQYRARLSAGIEQVEWVFLKGDYDTLHQRMRMRQDHFMPVTLLRSQLDTLEPPTDALVIDILHPPSTIVQTIVQHLQSQPTSVPTSPLSEFGLYGLGVMGKSLACNLARKGVRLSLYNRRVEGVEELVAEKFTEEYSELSDARGYEDETAFVASIGRPRRIFLMVQAGPVVDAVVASLLPHLDSGDIIIDGGNSHYRDTQRRTDSLAGQGIQFIGCGVSGGEKGALEGPAIMPGGAPEAYAQVSTYLERIAATDPWGAPCCAHVGAGGAGHFVKMVHNGIEYAEMQLLAEVYQIFTAQGWSYDHIADLLSTWNEGDLNSYLLEITIDILRKRDDKGDYLLDDVLDKAGNKGTGSWTTIAMAELGVPATMISAALFARYISSFKEERVAAAAKLGISSPTGLSVSASEVEQSYRLARIVNHHQGIHLISTASQAYQWSLDLPALARIWTNGCIIRSRLMVQLVTVLADTDRILTHPDYRDLIHASRDALSQVTSRGIAARLPLPCFSAATDYLQAYTSAQSSAHVIQAQRDYFGAHTYRSVSRPEAGAVHSEWAAE